MSDPTLKIRVTGDLDAIKAQIKTLGGDIRTIADASKQAGRDATRGFDSAEQAARALTDQLNRGAIAARAQGEAAKQAARDQRRASDEAAVAERKRQRDQERAARQAEADRLRALRAQESERKRQERAAQQAADKQRRQESNRTAQVAPQVTDIVTQLASGSNPLLVLLQQGGQLRDIFGGVSQAIVGTGRAVLGLISPVGIAIGAVGALAFAFFKGQDESLRFNRALILTGNTAGETSERLQEMAQDLGDLDGSTVRSAANTLAGIVESGKFAADQIEQVARAAEQMRNATGRDVTETIAEFGRIAEAPTAAVDELNRKYGFLTGTIREQIRQLEQQGKLQDAARLAVNAYANAINERTPKIRENLGLVQKAWHAIKEESSAALDSVLAIGRPQTGREQFDALFAERQKLQEELDKGFAKSAASDRFTFTQDLGPEQRAARQRRIEQINQQLKDLSDAEVAAQKEASRKAAQQRAVAIQGELSDEEKQYETAAQKRIRIRTSINNRANQAILDARTAGDKAAEEAIVASRDRVLAALDKESAKSAAAIVGVDVELVKDSVQRGLSELEEFYAHGKISLQNYFAEKQRLEAESIDAAIRGAQAELAAAQTAEERAKIESQITILQRDRSTLGVRNAREQTDAERELARALDDVKARIADANGDRTAVQVAQLNHEREDLLRKFANNPEASKFINQLFNVEVARANSQAIQGEADQLIKALESKENSISNQINAGTIDPSVGNQQLHAAREETILQLQRQRDALQQVFDAAPSPETLDAIRQLDDAILNISQRNLTGIQGAMQSLRAELAELDRTFTGNVVQNIQDGLANFFTSILNGSKSAGDALKDFVRGFAQAMLDIAARALATFAILQVLDAIYPGLGKATAATLGAGAGHTLHTGGIAGRDGRRRSINPLVFAAAPRYHFGGVAGLAPNEVPAILEKGEEVLPRNDPRNVMNGGGQQQMPGTRVINVFDPDFVPDQMNGPGGERVILNHIGKNPGRVRQLLGI